MRARRPLAVGAGRGLLRREAGFSFIEILVVMGIIAVLVGLGVGVYVIAFRKSPEFKTRALVQKIRGEIEFWKGEFGAFPPSDLLRLKITTGLPINVGKVPNLTNDAIESLYQCLMLAGFSHKPELADSELSNTDGDALDKPVPGSASPTLWEIRDAYGNPLVYFEDRDYAAAEKDPPTYILGSGPDSTEGGAAVTPKPWRLMSGGFAEPGRYQIFSMGPDGEPNTEDDIKAWGE